jgi:hypothetical protein
MCLRAVSVLFLGSMTAVSLLCDVDQQPDLKTCCCSSCGATAVSLFPVAVLLLCV